MHAQPYDSRLTVETDTDPETAEALLADSGFDYDDTGELLLEVGDEQRAEAYVAEGQVDFHFYGIEPTSTFQAGIELLLQDDAPESGVPIGMDVKTYLQEPADAAVTLDRDTVYGREGVLTDTSPR